MARTIPGQDFALALAVGDDGVARSETDRGVETRVDRHRTRFQRDIDPRQTDTAWAVGDEGTICARPTAVITGASSRRDHAAPACVVAVEETRVGWPATKAASVATSDAGATWSEMYPPGRWKHLRGISLGAQLVLPSATMGSAYRDQVEWVQRNAHRQAPPCGRHQGNDRLIVVGETDGSVFEASSVPGFDPEHHWTTTARGHQQTPSRHCPRQTQLAIVGDTSS